MMRAILPLLMLAGCATMDPSKPMLAPADIDRCAHKSASHRDEALPALSFDALTSSPHASPLRGDTLP